ncbi:methyltransferase domain-containing protein [Alteromonas pelagimontana]|uniref:tRNA (guanine(46)-N(7))-methyltransferase n=1 Tax=Alteromonas pelagimontana TaxID=1858656 RepID=A0A6M4ME12_9ALTE|nr:methyltransferase domain-containing protein [Alteromonas pelagimontana]QJR81431.1 methyltransferase domain-containing protein [Alteromonas pelagimontana]
MKEATGNSRDVSTNQTGVHEKLDALVARYQQNKNQRPVSEHTLSAFNDAVAWLGDWTGDIILDSCCGVGESTATIARQYPECKVIGLDKSAARVDKHEHYRKATDNYRVIRADVNDFWRLASKAQWPIKKHYLLYPNPYPKSAQVQKRWHASAAMVDMMALTPHIEVRSNWLIYLLEFAQAAKHYGLITHLTEVTTAQPITPFERKYRASGQVCWQLACEPEEAQE